MSEQNKLGLHQVAASVLAAFFGVQSDRARRRDFNRGRLRDFVLVGVGITALFVIVLWGAVASMLP